MSGFFNFWKVALSTKYISRLCTVNLSTYHQQLSRSFIHISCSSVFEIVDQNTSELKMIFSFLQATNVQIPDFDCLNSILCDCNVFNFHFSVSHILWCYAHWDLSIKAKVKWLNRVRVHLGLFDVWSHRGISNFVRRWKHLKNHQENISSEEVNFQFFSQRVTNCQSIKEMHLLRLVSMHVIEF